MPNAMVPLQNITLVSNAATVTFSNLPTTGFRDLVVVTTAFNTGGTADIWLRYNGDTGNNYNRIYMGGTGGVAYSGTNQGTVNYVVYSTTTNENNTTIHIMDYSATDKHKVNLCRQNAASNSVSAFAGRWASTAAITSILFGTDGASFAAGSTFSLYGIVG